MLSLDAMTALATAALFLLMFTAIRGWLAAAAARSAAAARLSLRRRDGLLARAERGLAALAAKPAARLSLLLESARAGIGPAAFLGLSALLAVAGGAAGALAVQTVKGAVVAAVLCGGLPYIIVRMTLTHRQMQSRIDFLPAVELFYQSYLTTGGRQVRVALARMVEERRLAGPLLPVFEQLYINLSVKGDDEASLRVFSAAVGHVWADYFANLLRVALADGTPIADNLKELIGDMRRAARADQQERNRLLEIRLANFSPILFLALFIGVNVRYNPDGAYRYYVLDPHGRDMLLNAAALIFASFLMGIWLSRRRL
mgnify:CR=1 FL=1|jgi:hypothetical protein